jgi:hypothetical protein
MTSGSKLAELVARSQSGICSAAQLYIGEKELDVISKITSERTQLYPVLYIRTSCSARYGMKSNPPRTVYNTFPFPRVPFVARTRSLGPHSPPSAFANQIDPT